MKLSLLQRGSLKGAGRSDELGLGESIIPFVKFYERLVLHLGIPTDF